MENGRQIIESNKHIVVESTWANWQKGTLRISRVSHVQMCGPLEGCVIPHFKSLLVILVSVFQVLAFPATSNI